VCRSRRVGRSRFRFVPAGAVFSFLKQVSGEPLWNETRLMQVLGIEVDAASRVTPLLEMMGYAEPVCWPVPVRRGCRRIESVQ
jgi:hypothetical protein